MQSSVLEWRLLAPAMRTLVGEGKQIVIVGPPKPPRLLGLKHLGLDERHIVWIRADKPVERLWATNAIVVPQQADVSPLRIDCGPYDPQERPRAPRLIWSALTVN